MTLVPLYLLAAGAGLAAWALLYRPAVRLPDFGRVRTAVKKPGTLAQQLQQVPLLRHWTPLQFRLAQGLTAALAAAAFAVPRLASGTEAGFGTLAAGLIGALSWPLGLKLTLYRRRQAMSVAFFDLVDHLVLQVRAGATPLQAFTTAPRVVREPLRSELIPLVADLGIRPMEAALMDFAARTGNLDLLYFAQGVVQHAQTGVDIASILATQQQLHILRVKERTQLRIRQAAAFLAFAVPVIFFNVLALWGVIIFFEVTRALS